MIRMDTVCPTIDASSPRQSRVSSQSYRVDNVCNGSGVVSVPAEVDIRCSGWVEQQISFPQTQSNLFDVLTDPNWSSSYFSMISNNWRTSAHLIWPFPTSRNPAY